MLQRSVLKKKLLPLYPWDPTRPLEKLKSQHKSLRDVYAAVYTGGNIEVQIEDGNGHLMKEWEDFLEESD